MDVICLLIALATFNHWDMRSRGINVRHFGQCSPQWSHLTLTKAVCTVINFNQ